MPRTYTPSGVTLLGDGEEAGVWGQLTNTNMQTLDRMVSQAGTITLSGTTHTLTVSDGTLSDGQYGVLVFGGSPSGTNTVTISPNDAKRTFIVKNASGETVTLTQGSGGDVSVPDGRTAIVYCDGAGSGAEVVNVSDTFLVGDATLTTVTTSGDVTAGGQFVGIDDAAGGAATLPAFTFDGETTTTGMFLPSANTLAFSTDGTERLRVSSTGNVGVGTSSPVAELDVSGDIRLGGKSTENQSVTIGAGRTGDGISFIDLVGDTTYSDYGLRVIRQGAGANTNSDILHRGTGNLRLNIQEAGDLVILTDGSERMRIDSSGNVGIGTSTPAHQFEVENSGGSAIIAATSSATGTSQLRLGDTANTGAGRVEYDNDTNAMGLVTAGVERVSVSSSGITVTGTVDATDFTGDGSALTGVVSPTEVSEVATTSGTAVNIITGIPSGVNTVELYFYDVSISAADFIVIQLGTSVSYSTSGYNGYTARGASGTTLTSGMPVIFSNADTASANKSGLMRLHRVPGTNKWVAGSEAGYTTSTGSIDLGAQLTRLRVTTNAGTATFDNGGISARYY